MNSYAVTVHFAANGETSEIDEYTERSFSDKSEALSYYADCAIDCATGKYGVSGVRLEEFNDDGILEIGVIGTYANWH